MIVACSSPMAVVMFAEQLKGGKSMVFSFHIMGQETTIANNNCACREGMG